MKLLRLLQPVLPHPLPRLRKQPVLSDRWALRRPIRPGNVRRRERRPDPAQHRVRQERAFRGRRARASRAPALPDRPLPRGPRHVVAVQLLRL